MTDPDPIVLTNVKATQPEQSDSVITDPAVIRMALENLRPRVSIKLETPAWADWRALVDIDDESHTLVAFHGAVQSVNPGTFEAGREVSIVEGRLVVEGFNS